ncbi:S-adenosyl-L-methionine-dependent methyltransferase [Desarmillaria tabescens]|uniref:Cytosine-specific methyltransferase n=1 Tax=Armillaria tabescens TaxID=1929756 RepID=A0AA39TR99_ARMTA|nr:S-adenosyl-L-methionine-dependent methyltransferase [Desarmillaria tabescens]KAK0463813.1 S-adenosyl-L-methionine-dependent methyltransferase [Desarmillaria tabescens]
MLVVHHEVVIQFHTRGQGLRLSPTVSDFFNNNGAGPSTAATMSGTTLNDNLQRDLYQMNVLDASATTYQFQDEEFDETDGIAIPGEIEPDCDQSDNDVPVRILDDFVIYDDQQNIVGIEALNTLTLPLKSGKKGKNKATRTFRASGIVRAKEVEGPEDDIDHLSDLDEGESVMRLRLGCILDFNVHHFSEKTQQLDGNIYICTDMAWYILHVPSDIYAPFFRDFFVKHRVAHQVASHALQDRRATYEDFVTSLGDIHESTECVSSQAVIGRDINIGDVVSDDTIPYLIGTLPVICANADERLKTVPLIKHFFEAAGTSIELFDDGDSSYASIDTPSSDETSESLSDRAMTPSSTTSFPRSKAKKKSPEPRKLPSNKEKAVLMRRATTVVTPIVGSIAEKLYRRNRMEVAGTLEQDEAPLKEVEENVKLHYDNPEKIIWGERIAKHHYATVHLDGVEYQAGDVIMVLPPNISSSNAKPSTDDGEKRAEDGKSLPPLSKNTFGNRYWFCRICYFFYDEEDKTKKFHGHWSEHGSRTLMKEVAHSKALFQMKTCDDSPIASIIRRVDVKMLGERDNEYLDDGDPESTDYFCSLVWDNKQHEFTDLPSIEEVLDATSYQPPHLKCYPCALKAREDAHGMASPTKGGVTHYGIDYHIHDCVYVRNEDPDVLLLSIGQVRSINIDKEEVKVVYLGRYNDHESTTDPNQEERQLFMSQRTQSVAVRQLQGLCFVKHLVNEAAIRSWIKHDDHFYLNQVEDSEGGLIPLSIKSWKKCKHGCFDDHEQELRDTRRLRDRNSPLRGLELFSGAGGLGTGMMFSGFVETKWAVELSPSAAQTYKCNHPDTIVYDQDANILLDHAVQTEHGKYPRKLKSYDGTYLENMPKKDEVEFIYGGPPCQSFSKANHNPKPDDIRSTLPMVMLAYTEWYKPRYFLLENVAGMLTARLGAQSASHGRSLVGGMEMGVLKLILRILTSLGYQVRVKILQAGAYGAPQQRNRILIWGAQRGLPLPEFPIPTHAFQRLAFRWKLPSFEGESLSRATRSRNPEDDHQCAPLKPMTVDEAIGDLPPWDWINPHKIIHSSDDTKKETQCRIDIGIKQILAVTSVTHRKPGIDNAEYIFSPRNAYQRWMRQANMPTVNDHHTKTFSQRVVEASTSVPLKPNANQKDMNHRLCSKHMINSKYVFYGRLNGNGYFRTAMTLVSPNSKHSVLLHPHQKRIISVREAARAQGFPDNYTFCSINKANSQSMIDDQYRQIGNAVPVPLALALGKSLGAALFKTWKKKDREGSPSV